VHFRANAVPVVRRSEIVARSTSYAGESEPATGGCSRSAVASSTSMSQAAVSIDRNQDPHRVKRRLGGVPAGGSRIFP